MTQRTKSQRSADRVNELNALRRSLENRPHAVVTVSRTPRTVILQCVCGAWVFNGPPGAGHDAAKRHLADDAR